MSKPTKPKKISPEVGAALGGRYETQRLMKEAYRQPAPATAPSLQARATATVLWPGQLHPEVAHLYGKLSDEDLRNLNSAFEERDDLRRLARMQDPIVERDIEVERKQHDGGSNGGGQSLLDEAQWESVWTMWDTTRQATPRRYRESAIDEKVAKLVLANWGITIAASTIASARRARDKHQKQHAEERCQALMAPLHLGESKG